MNPPTALLPLVDGDACIHHLQPARSLGSPEVFADTYSMIELALTRPFRQYIEDKMVSKHGQARGGSGTPRRTTMVTTRRNLESAS